MLKLLSTTFLIFLTTCCYAQGSWDIGYIHVDTISRQHIGQVVRIDFKTINSWTNSESQRGIRSFVGTKDTGSLTIDSTLFVFVERRKIYVDHGSYSDQYLECINCNLEKVTIYDAKIVDVNKQSIQFLINIESKTANQILRKETKFVRVVRDKLDGVMIER